MYVLGFHQGLGGPQADASESKNWDNSSQICRIVLWEYLSLSPFHIFSALDDSPVAVGRSRLLAMGSWLPLLASTHLRVKPPEGHFALAEDSKQPHSTDFGLLSGVIPQKWLLHTKIDKISPKLKKQKLSGQQGFPRKTFRIKCVNLDIADFVTNALKT